MNKFREDILAAYLIVASNMVSIAEMSGGKRTVGPAIRAVASGTPLLMGTPPQVGLIVYGFDEDQKNGKIWNGHLKKLRDSPIGSDLVRARGDANGLKL